MDSTFYDNLKDMFGSYAGWSFLVGCGEETFNYAFEDGYLESQIIKLSLSGTSAINVSSQHFDAGLLDIPSSLSQSVAINRQGIDDLTHDGHTTLEKCFSDECGEDDYDYECAQLENLLNTMYGVNGLLSVKVGLNYSIPYGQNSLDNISLTKTY